MSLRGTLERTYVWRWLANEANSVAYAVPRAITPVVDVTQNYPLVYKYNRTSAVQGLAGPANATQTVGPPIGKAWLIDQMGILVNPIRVGNVHVHIKANTAAGFGAGIRVPLCKVHTGFLTANQDFPVLGVLSGAAGAANVVAGHPKAGIYLAGQFAGAITTPTIAGEVLEITAEALTMTDVFELSFRYLEFPLDSPPGG